MATTGLNSRSNKFDWATPVWSSSTAKLIDQLCVDDYKFPSYSLGEIAGRKIAEFMFENFSIDEEIFIICGPGNNGEVGRIAGRHLKSAGWAVDIIEYSHFQAKAQEFEGRVIIDAIFGLGFEIRENDSKFESCCSEVNRAKKIISIDTPSGLDANSLEIPKEFIKADFTLTFGQLKPCHVASSARDACGQVIVIDIGFDVRAMVTALDRMKPFFAHINPEKIFKFPPWNQLSPSANKFDRGHVLIIGGSKGKLGAPILSAKAALKSGAGWASVALPVSELALSPFPIELTFEDFFHSNIIDLKKFQTFVESRKVTSIVIGPGTVEPMMNDEIISYLCSVSFKKIFIILDAAATKGILNFKNLHADPNYFIITPHPGEWLKLRANNSIVPSHYDKLQKISEDLLELGISAIYKGATPFIFNRTECIYVSTAGTHALARAGSGDVFAGCLASLGVFQDMAIAHKAAYALSNLGRAGINAGKTCGLHSVTPEDLVKFLRA